ncbi:reverse transcriptase domain-containing protein [Tanacetum coccineum]
MTAHHNDWDTSAQRNKSSSYNNSSNPEIASLKLQMEEMNRNFTKTLQTNQQVNTEDEREEEILMDQDNSEFTIKVPPPPVQQVKPPKQRDFVIHRRDPRHPNIPEALELENTPVSENCSAVILKKPPEKLGDPGKFLIPCGFNELKCKALADLGANINLMPLSVWKELGLPKLIPTQMTLELANRNICTPKGIARYVFFPVGKFTFLSDFVIIDYESDPRVSLILGRPFLRTARTLIDVHGEEMILHDDNERLILNMTC